MKNLLKQYLEKPEHFEEEVTVTEKPLLEKKVKKVKKVDGLIEVVERTILIEDGRQILND